MTPETPRGTGGQDGGATLGPIRHETGRRRRRSRVILGISLAALLLLALSIVVRGPLDGWVRQWLERTVARQAGGTLELGELELRLARGELRFADARLSFGETGGARLSIGIERGRVLLRPAAVVALLAGRVRLALVELERPTVEWIAAPPGAPPGPERAATGIDLVMEQLSIREGSVHVADQTVPLELQARNVELRGAWDEVREALIGSLSLHLDLERPPFIEPLALELAGRFRLRRHDVELRELHAKGPGLAASASGLLTFASPPRFVGRGQVEADIEALAALADPELPPLRGRCSANFSAEAGDGPLTLRGSARAESPRLGRLAADEAAGTFQYHSGQLAVDNLVVRWLDGRVTGRIDWDPAAQPPMRATLAGGGVDLARFLRWLGQPLPVAGALEAQLELEGDPAATRTWSGRGSFAAAARPAGPEAVPVAGTGELRIDRGRVALESAIEAASSRFDARLALDLDGASGARLELEGATRNARDTQLATLCLTQALGVELPEPARRPLGGVGSFRTTIETGPRSRVALGLDLTGARYAEAWFDRLELELELAQRELHVTHLALSRGSERLEATARLGLEPLVLEALVLEAREVDTRWLVPALGLPLELTGRLSASIDHDEAEGSSSGSVQVTDGVLAGEPFSVFDAQVRLAGTTVTAAPWHITGPAGEAGGTAEWRGAMGEWGVVVKQGTLDLGMLSIVRERSLPFDTGLELEGRVVGRNGEVSGRIALRTRELQLAGRAPGDAHGTAIVEQRRLQLYLDADDGRWSASGQVALDGDSMLEARVDLNDAVIEAAAGGPAAAWLRIRGGAELRGPLADPARIELSGRVEAAELHSGEAVVSTTEPVRVFLRAGRVRTGPIRLAGPGSDLTVAVDYDLEAERFDASAKGRVDLAFLAAQVPELRAAGELQLDLEAQGTWDAPDLRGTLSCQSGRVRWLGFPQALEQLDFRIAIDGARARIEELEGRLGSGEIRASGEGVLTRQGLETLHLAVDASNVRLAYPEGFRGLYEGRITIDSAGDEVKLGGRVELLRGLYTKNFDLWGRSTRAYVPIEDASLPENVTLDLEFVAAGDTWVRNDLAQVEARFELHVGGTLRRPEITGRTWLLEGGTLTFRDVEYRLESGSIDFIDRERLDPYLTLRAETQVRDYTIFLRVEGTAGQFTYDLTSDPSLSTQDIVALLATGQTLEERGTESGASGDAAVSYFAGTLTQPVERQAEKALGLERVRIDPLLTEGESDPTTRLTVGEQVNDDLWVILSADLTANERQLYQVDWRASRHVRLTAQRDTQGGLGGDVRLTRRFWFHPPPTVVDAGASSASPAPAERVKVKSVRFEGLDQAEAAELERLLSFEAGDDFSRTEMFAGVEAIKRQEVREQRIQTVVDAIPLTTPEGVEVVYRVSRGPQVGIEFQGPTKKEERRLRQALSELWIDSVFLEDVYTDAEQRIREFYHERGYYAADVRRDMAHEDGTERVTFIVDKGKPVKVAAVRIVGAHALPEERIRAQMLVRPSTVLGQQLLVPRVLADDVKAIRVLYRDEGFLHVQVKEPQVTLNIAGDAAEVEIEVVEGPRFVVESLAFSPDLPFTDEELRTWADFEIGAVFSPARLREAEDRLRAAIDARGYPEARVRGRFEAGASSASVRFEIVAGARKEIGDIQIDGNHLTKDKIIRRELGLDVGDALSRDRLLRSQHQLYRLGLFRNVQVTSVPLDPEQPGLERLQVTVQEGPPLSSTFGVGYDTEARGKVSASLTHENLGGYDRVLSVQGKYSGLEERLQLVAKEPRLFAHRVPALLSAGWSEEEEEGFTERRVATSLRVDRRFGERWSSFLRYSLQRVDLFDVTISPAELEEEKLVEGRLGDVGLTVIRDTRDNPFLAKHGKLLTLGTRVFASPLASEFTFVKNDVGWSGVWPVRRAESLAVGARLGLAYPYGPDGAVPISEAYFAGGDSTLRGFDRDSVGPASGGEAMLLVNGEYRFPIWKALKGIVFYDTGNVWEKASELDPTDLRHVLGTGLRLETPIGPLRLEYGHKLDREDEESSGELFLAIGSPF